MIAVTKNTLAELESYNPEKVVAIRKYLQDSGLSRQTVSHLRTGRHLSSRSVEVLQGMAYDLALRTTPKK